MWTTTHSWKAGNSAWLGPRSHPLPHHNAVWGCLTLSFSFTLLESRYCHWDCFSNVLPSTSGPFLLLPHLPGTFLHQNSVWLWEGETSHDTPYTGWLYQMMWKEKKAKWLSHVWLFATPWTIAYHASPSMGFSRQEYWSGLPFPSPGDLPNPGIKPGSLALYPL